MSGNASDDPRWLRELEQELGLGDTPVLDDSDREEITLLESIKRTEFTPQGWARVYSLIMRAQQNPELFRRLVKTDADALLFTAMIALPYQLGLSLGYNSKLCEKLVTFVAASYIIALTRGYEMGQQDMIEERPSRDE